MLAIMLENARHFYGVAVEAEANLAKMTIGDLGAGDLAPDQQFKLLLAEVKKTAGFRQMAQEAARDAAPYLHARLTSIEAKITHREEMTPDELRRAIVARLARLGLGNDPSGTGRGEDEAGPSGRLN
jgi:hypothetical protein